MSDINVNPDINKKLSDWEERMKKKQAEEEAEELERALRESEVNRQAYVQRRAIDANKPLPWKPRG